MPVEADAVPNPSLRAAPRWSTQESGTMPQSPPHKPRTSTQRAVVALALVFSAATGCDRHRARATADAGPAHELTVSVPAALRIARGLDTLSVELDPDLLANKAVRVERGRSIGVAYTARVHERGRTRIESTRHGYVPGRGFDVGTLVWRTDKDGLPRAGRKYQVEMQLLLFETDVKPGPHWNPHAGHFHVLLEKTLSQAEE